MASYTSITPSHSDNESDGESIDSDSDTISIINIEIEGSVDDQFESEYDYSSESEYEFPFLTQSMEKELIELQNGCVGCRTHQANQLAHIGGCLDEEPEEPYDQSIPSSA